jgi:cephalosporin hydroxylase
MISESKGEQSSIIGVGKDQGLFFLQVFTFYDNYLNDFYQRNPNLISASYEQQLTELIKDGFGGLHVLEPYFKDLGYESKLVIANCLPLQAQWAFSHGIEPKENSWKEDILRAQINYYKPDIFYTLNPLEFDSKFLNSVTHKPNLVVGWRAADIPADVDWDRFDLILSHLSVCRNLAEKHGAKNADFFHPAVSEEIGKRVAEEKKLYDVVFTGQWSGIHKERNQIISYLVELSNKFGFSLGLFLSADPRDLPPHVAAKNQGARWGLEMYKVLRQGRIIINAEVDMAKGDAGNLRFFETVTCGSFLLTQQQNNVSYYFEPGSEIETFSSYAELESKISFYLKHSELREKIAINGHKKALETMSLPIMANKLDKIFKNYLNKKRETQSMEQSETIIDRALSALENKNTSQALQIIENASFTEKQQQNIEYVRAMCYIELGQLRQAKSSLEREIEKFPYNSQAKDLLEQVIAVDTPKPAENLELSPEKINADLQQAVDFYQQGKPIDAMRILEQVNKLPLPPIPGFHYLRTVTFNAVGRHEEALEAAKLELKINPGHGGARSEFESLSKALAKKVAPPLNPEQRSYNSAIPFETLTSIQNASHNYSYRGVPMIKNPFDHALYPLLLWNIKPKTIIEIGSKNGGSALWFGDLMNNFGIDAHIYSLDIVKVEDVSHPKVTFMEANGRELEKTLSKSFIDSLPRPILVIEDADHSYETSSAVMKFFHPFLKGDEYMIIEDGIISDLSKDPSTNSGPHRAIKEFIAANPGEYEIDCYYNDYFGYNFTWCTNGFLKKKKYPINQSIPKSLVTLFNQDDSATKGVESQMCTNERFQLYSAVTQYLPKQNSYRYIEVGSYSGASFQLIHEAFKRLNAQAFGFTVEPEGTQQFYQVIPTLSNVEHLKMFSDKAAPILNDKLQSLGGLADFIMIDGDHTYEGVKADIINYYQLLAKGGVMVFHDFLPELNDQNREAIMFHHAGNEPGIRKACLELMEGQYNAERIDIPLLYPTDPTQTQPHLPEIPGVFSTIRAYRKR